MNLTEIQPNLLALIQGLDIFADVQQQILADDGFQATTMEDGLNSKGIAILILYPEGDNTKEQTRGAAIVEYFTAVWCRTSPKSKTEETTEAAAIQKWNALQCQEVILNAIMQWSKGRNDWGFQIAPGMKPELVEDPGNISFLIPLIAKVHFH